MFKKSVIIGVSVTPEIGLEVAQIDFAAQKVLKYGVRPLEYNPNTREIADLDLFKEALQDLCIELQIPKGAEIVLNIPAVTFNVKDFPASLDEAQVGGVLEEEFAEHQLFQNTDPCISATLLPNSTIQFNKVAYVAAQKTMLVEVAMAIKDLGFKLYAVDTSVNSVLNSLIYKERVNVAPDTSWVLLLVDTFCCRIISMSGRNYVDAYEERISIGEVLGDAENYSTVINAVTPILKNLPSKYLCVVSKTNVISAEVLASKLTYSAPIIHQEANSFSREAFLELAPDLDPALAPMVSLDIIGAAIYRDFAPESNAHFNLYNESLGDIYLNEQPPVINLGGRKIVLSLENLIKMLIVIAVLVIVPTIAAIVYLSSSISTLEDEKSALQAKISQIDKFLKDNENISADLFDEGDEIRVGLGHNKNIYSYYSIVGTEIPKKLWLTHLKLSDKVTVEGQADNLESVYAFFRSIKDYNPNSGIKLQKLGLAAGSKQEVLDDNEFDTDSILTSMNADFYEFRISDEPEVAKDKIDKKAGGNSNLPADLEAIKE